MKDQLAFPIVERTEHIDGQVVCNQYPGMTMRQYYKAAALQGLLANCFKEQFKHNTPEVYANNASLIADAMIAEDLEHEKRGRSEGS